MRRDNENGPKRVVWALDTSFFFSWSCSTYQLIIYLLYLGQIYVLKAQGRCGYTGTMKTGPNDSFGPQVHCFYLFSSFFTC